MFIEAAIPELFGKYVFGDLAIRNAPPRVDGRLFYADLEDGTISEFLLPQFANDQLPNGLTVHGFGEDGNGELYAMVTNTPANGAGESSTNSSQCHQFPSTTTPMVSSMPPTTSHGATPASMASKDMKTGVLTSAKLLATARILAGILPSPNRQRW